MPTVAFDQIVVSDRQRKVLEQDDIAKLAKSIQTYGLFHPPLMTRREDGKLELLMGFCRLQAMLSLGWEEIPYTLKEEADPVLLKEMELEENIRRKNLEWWEEAQATAEIHEMRKSRDPSWNIRKTADLVGASTGTVSQAIQLRNEVLENPEMKEEKTLTGALKKLDVKKRREKKRKDIERRAKGLLPSLRAEIVVGDAASLISQEEDESFDAVITNLPFGIDLEFKGGKKPYEDDEGANIRLVQKIVTESFRVLRDDSWFVAWYDARKITYSNAQWELYKRFHNRSGFEAPDLHQLLFDSMGLAFWLEKAGFSYVNVIPAYWIKPNKLQGMIGDPRKGLITAAEAMIFATKGQAFFMKQGQNNVFIYDTLTPSEREYSMQMPTDLCTEIVSMVCMGGARVLDPFAGSGSIGLGALNHQCEFRGYELNPEAANIGNARLKEHHLAAAKKEAESASA